MIKIEILFDWQQLYTIEDVDFPKCDCENSPEFVLFVNGSRCQSVNSNKKIKM